MEQEQEQELPHLPNDIIERIVAININPLRAEINEQERIIAAELEDIDDLNHELQRHVLSNEILQLAYNGETAQRIHDLINQRLVDREAAIRNLREASIIQMRARHQLTLAINSKRALGLIAEN